MKKQKTYTKDEAVGFFLSHVWDVIDNWGIEDLPMTLRERLSGLAFSILVALDGGAMDLPSFKVIPIENKADEPYNAKHGLQAWPEVDLGGSLHEIFHGFEKSRTRSDFYELLAEGAAQAQRARAQQGRGD